MRQFTKRAIGTLTAAVAICAISGGVASAAGQVAAPAEAQPIWLLPGVDASSLLAPTVDLPTQVLKPVDGLLTLLNG